MSDDIRQGHDNDDGVTRLVDDDPAATATVPSEPSYRLGEFASLNLLDRLELPIEVRLGKITWDLERVLETRVGDAVPIGPDGEDVVTLYVQERPYAVGDLVVLDGRFAFRVRELISGALAEEH